MGGWGLGMVVVGLESGFYWFGKGRELIQCPMLVVWTGPLCLDCCGCCLVVGISPLAHRDD